MHNIRKLAVGLLATSAFVYPITAFAQTARDTGAVLESVVVTGIATPGGTKKLDASYSITSLTPDQIQEANPTVFGDLLKNAPGVYVDTSGGPTGNNLAIAGFPGNGASPYVSFEINGVPIFPTPSQANLEPTMMFRLDDSLQRLEMAQGGPTVLYGIGASALTVNYILKRGTDTLSGDAAITYGSEGMVRLDGFAGLPIDSANKIYASIGGFITSNDNGVRDPQFASKPGGQLTGTVSKEWSDGSLLVYARYLKTNAQFETDTPIYNNGRGQFSSYPGISPLTGTLESKADQYTNLQVSPCAGTGCVPGSIPINLADGRGSSMYTVGSEFSWDFGNGLTLLDDFAYSGGKMLMVALYSTGSTTAGQNPETLSAYLANRITANKLAANTSAFAYYTDTGAAVPLTQNVLTDELRYLGQTFRSASNELHLSYELFPGNTVTVGNYIALYGVNEFLYTSANILLQAQNNPSPIAITLTNAAGTYQLTNSQGFSQAPQSAVHNNNSNFKDAFFLSDSWKFDRFLFDVGIRVDHTSFVDHFQNTAVGSLSGNPFQLYNAKAQYLTSGTTVVPYHATGVSWSVGLNYEFSDNMSTYARVNRGVLMLAPGQLSPTTLSLPMQHSDNYEIGYKYATDWLYVDLNGFHRELNGISGGGLFSFNGASQQLNYLYGTHAWGTGWQAVFTPFAGSGDALEGFSVGLNGDWAIQHYAHSGCVTVTTINNTTQSVCNASLVADGDALTRQPDVQLRLTPSYTLPTDWGFVKAWFTLEFIGQHYGDMYQQQNLGQFTDFSAGVMGNVGQNWEWSVRGSNIFNQIGITEGNSRDLGGSITSNNVILGRSIMGREINVQLKYKF